MSALRFTFQANAVRNTTGIVLNVGANEDPAGLKGLAPDRVINTDIEAVDSHLQRPNNFDVLFDAAKEKWPFADDSAEMVVFGDILEHLMPEDCAAVLKEARRVATKLCITVPREIRPDNINQVTPEGNPYMFHQVEVTEEYLTQQLDTAGWKVEEWQTIDYEFVPEGYLVIAVRA